MSRSRSRRTRSSVKKTQKDKQEQTTAKVQLATWQISRKHRLWRAWQSVWGILGPSIALTGLFFLLKPEIQIAPSVNLDPSEPLSTQFLISNRGHVPVYNMTFSCGLGKRRWVHIGHMRPGNLMSVETLPAGTAVTRSCATESADINTNAVIISITYAWPIVGWKSTEESVFTIVHGTPGFFLVPDFPNLSN